MPVLRSPACAAAYAASLAVLLTAAPPAGAAAQTTRTLTACTPDALGVCTELQLTAGPRWFEIALRTVGATGSATAPLSVYNLVLGTGAAAVGTPVATDVAPVAIGGATVADASPWEVFDSGDALFLSALTNRGVGGCVAGTDVDGFGQAATTCSAGQFIAFRFAPTAAFDVRLFQITDLEAVALTSPAQGASCGAAGDACVITADQTISATAPEPGPAALLGAGLLTAAALARRRRVGVRA